MENKSITTTTTIFPATTKKDNKAIAHLEDEKQKKKKKKKKRSPFNLLKVALLIVRGRSKQKSNSVQVEVASKGMLNKLVGSMRRLHLQDNPSSPTSVPTISLSTPSVVVEHFEDVLPPPSSPHGSSSSSSTTTDSTSRYASANNLQELDKGGGSRCASSSNLQELDDQSDDGIDDRAGDEMIDVKAEQFIAQFYHQMRLQRFKSTN